MKEAMSAFDLHAIVRELRPLVLQSHMENFYQINFNTLLLRLRRPMANYDLVVEAGRRIHLTRFSYQKAARMSAFCKFLRANLTNGLLLDIHQPELERVVEFEIQAHEARFRLIFEFFDKGNIIVTDGEGAILRASTYRKMRDRNIIRGEKYKPPPARGLDPRLVTLGDLTKLQAMRNIQVVRGLARLLSLPGAVVEEIIKETGIDKTKGCQDLSQRELEGILNVSKTIVDRMLGDEFSPQIVLGSDGLYLDVVTIPLKIYSGSKLLMRASFNEAADEYFGHLTEDRLTTTAQDAQRKEISELERILSDQKAKLEELEREDASCVKMADLLVSHIDALADLLHEVRSEYPTYANARGSMADMLSSSLGQIAPEAVVEKLDRSTGRLHFRVENQEFTIDTKISDRRNISATFERAKRARQKARALRAEIENTEGKIRQKLVQIEQQEKAELKPKKIRIWYEKFHWFISSSGTLVLGGRDATTNEILLKKHLENSDLVMHSDIHGAPFVLLKGQRKTEDFSTLQEAAQFAASYSSAWKSGLSSVDVYWITPDQVSKTPPSGAYLKKGMFMIYGTKNYIRDVKVGLAVGVKQEEIGPNLICGPVGAVKRQTDIWVSIVPGDMPSEKAARAIILSLATKAPPDIRKDIAKIPVSEVQLLFPAGRTHVITDKG